MGFSRLENHPPARRLAGRSTPPSSVLVVRTSKSTCPPSLPSTFAILGLFLPSTFRPRHPFQPSFQGLSTLLGPVRTAVLRSIFASDSRNDPLTTSWRHICGTIYSGRLFRPRTIYYNNVAAG
ncbi:hypothetical protein GALMADRAFT_1208406 [Galerina marginata CBS 339.88]|uniref:Uncharacterized protein n=1 Tax=Galerina marginata (strain CBS 339.88) TaxID=685588 RepID=A0A067S5K5_GALM3|nr:hypothetical protein GALMADRAFT_1208406 [Galerina marginata CBS 339.88]